MLVNKNGDMCHQPHHEQKVNLSSNFMDWWWLFNGNFQTVLVSISSHPLSTPSFNLKQGAQGP
jgi:hypothetical protein